MDGGLIKVLVLSNAEQRTDGVFGVVRGRHLLSSLSIDQCPLDIFVVCTLVCDVCWGGWVDGCVVSHLVVCVCVRVCVQECPDIGADTAARSDISRFFLSAQVIVLFFDVCNRQSFTGIQNVTHIHTTRHGYIHTCTRSPRALCAPNPVLIFR
jgi:hypothetical protein